MGRTLVRRRKRCDVRALEDEREQLVAFALAQLEERERERQRIVWAMLVRKHDLVPRPWRPARGMA